MKLDSGSDLKQLKVDGGMTNGDLTMSILADIGGFSVIRPEMREYVLIFIIALVFFIGLDNTFFPQVDSSWFGYLCWSCYQTFWLGLEES
jgi:sugar (pentulose or hexulose) kinase